MAELFPRQMAFQLPALLSTAVGGIGQERNALRQAQRALQSILPALKEHGAEAGIGGQAVVQVNARALSALRPRPRPSLSG